MSHIFNVVNTLKAYVIIRNVEDHIRISIKDKRKGFDLNAKADNPSQVGGLLNIQQRLSLMGCKLEIKSQPKKGTQVIIDIYSQKA